MPPAPVNWQLTTITADPGMTTLVFGAAVAGSRMIRPARTTPPVTPAVPVTAGDFPPNRHDDDTARARSVTCPGRASTTPGSWDDALTAPARSVTTPVLSRPAASTFGRTTGEPPS